MTIFNAVVMVVDRINTESEYKDVKCPKKGDVIDVLPASAELGKAIYQDDHDFWRVFQVDVQKAEIDALKVPEPGDPKTDLMLQFRAFYLDLTQLPQMVQDAIAQNPKAPIPVTLNELRAAKATRPKRAHSSEVGLPGAEAIIG